MARNKTLTSILDSYRSEARLSLNPAHNRAVRDTQVALLQRVQEWLWEEFNWPHLRVTRDVPLEAGQRYYDMPEDLDIDRIEKIEVRHDGRWCRLDVGIEANHYQHYDSDLDARAFPPRRWKITEEEQVEIHPVSDTDGDEETLEGMLRFTGIRRLSNFVDDADTADLDNRLITLYAAAETLAASGAKDAQLKLSQANKLNAKLRGALTPRRKFKMFGVGSEPKSLLRGPPSVYYRTED